MTVDFKSPVSSPNVNTAYMSRKDDTDTVGKVDLLNAGSATITDVQSVINVNISAISAAGASFTTHVDDYTAHREFDVKANLITFASSAADGVYCFATDEQKSYQVVSGILEEIGGGGVAVHNDLTGIQGGTSAEYYHLTSAGETRVRTENYTQTISNDFAIGDGADTDKTITAQNGDANEPQLKYDSATNKWQISNDGTTFINIPTTASGIQVAYIKDVKPVNTNGGDFSAAAWQPRVLNTVEGDSSIVSISSNQFTLQAGTYDISAKAPFFDVNLNKIKLRNITDSTDDIIGDSNDGQPSYNGSGKAELEGVITITSAKTFEIQHNCSSAKLATGFGIASNLGVVEVYTQVKITKI